MNPATELLLISATHSCHLTLVLPVTRLFYFPKDNGQLSSGSHHTRKVNKLFAKHNKQKGKRMAEREGWKVVSILKKLSNLVRN